MEQKSQSSMKWKFENFMKFSFSTMSNVFNKTYSSFAALASSSEHLSKKRKRKSTRDDDDVDVDRQRIDDNSEMASSYSTYSSSVVTDLPSFKKRRKLSVLHTVVSPPQQKTKSKYDVLPDVFRPSPKRESKTTTFVQPQQKVFGYVHAYPFIPYYGHQIAPPPPSSLQQRHHQFNTFQHPYPDPRPFEATAASISLFDPSYRTPAPLARTSKSTKSPMQRAYEVDYDIASRTRASSYGVSGPFQDVIRDLRVSTNESILEAWGKYDNEIIPERRHLVEMTRRVIESDFVEDNSKNDDIIRQDEMNVDQEKDFSFLDELQNIFTKR